MVKRYKLDAYDNLVCKEDGYLIYYEDYQELEAEVARLREALEEIANMGEGYDAAMISVAEKALEVE